MSAREGEYVALYMDILQIISSSLVYDSKIRLRGAVECVSPSFRIYGLVKPYFQLFL